MRLAAMFGIKKPTPPDWICGFLILQALNTKTSNKWCQAPFQQD